ARILAAAGAAQRAVRDRHAVRRLETAEVPALHGAGEAAADGDAGHVDLLALDEMIRLDQVADVEKVRRIDTKFCQLLPRLDLGLREVPAVGLGEVLRLGKARTELDRGVAVGLFGTL